MQVLRESQRPVCLLLVFAFCAMPASGLSVAIPEPLPLAVDGDLPGAPAGDAEATWYAGASDPRRLAHQVSLAIAQQRAPADFDEHLVHAQDGLLRIIVNLWQRDAAVEAAVEQATTALHWYEDAPRFMALATPDEVGRLLGLHAVRFLEPDRPIEFSLSASVPQTNARGVAGSPGVWKLAGGQLVSDLPSGQLFTGAGITVAVVDSGIDKTHKDFGAWDCEPVPYMPCQSRIKAAVKTDAWVDSGLRAGEMLPATEAASGHGTHVAGTVLGNGYYARDGDANTAWGGDGIPIGVAPQASLVSISTGDSQSAAFGVAALQYLLDHAEEWDVRVATNSWGCENLQTGAGCAYDRNGALAAVQKDLYDAGVLVTFAVGNNGGSDAGEGFSGYAQSPYVLAVASHDGDTGQLASTSSRGAANNDDLPDPATWDPDAEAASALQGGHRRPDVSAPGVGIYAARTLTGGTSSGPPRANVNDALGGATIGYYPYVQMGGTSMATPHVAGAAALLFEACPEATPRGVMRAIMAGADPAGVSASAAYLKGYGALDVRASLDWLLASPDCTQGDPDPVDPEAPEWSLYLHRGQTGVGNADQLFVGMSPMDSQPPVADAPAVASDVSTHSGNGESPNNLFEVRWIASGVHTLEGQDVVLSMHVTNANPIETLCPATHSIKLWFGDGTTWSARHDAKVAVPALLPGASDVVTGRFEDVTGSGQIAFAWTSDSLDCGAGIALAYDAVPAPSRLDVYPVPNEAPLASFTADIDGLDLLVDGSASVDPDGDAITHTWTFGDGNGADGPTAQHRYEEPGTYTVTLTVSDGRLSHASSEEVTAQDPVPIGVLRIESPSHGATVTAGQVTFSGTARQVAPLAATILEDRVDGTAGTPVSFTAEVSGGDGEAACTWTAEAGSITGDCAGATGDLPQGEWTVTLTATDSTGTASDTATAVVAAPPPALSADAGGPYTGTPGAPTAIAGSGAGGSGAKTCAWSVDQSPSGADVRFADAGACATTVVSDAAGGHVLRLTVSDATGSAVDTATWNVVEGSAISFVSPSNGAVVEGPVHVHGTFQPQPVDATPSAWFGWGEIRADQLASSGIHWEPWMDALRPAVEAVPGLVTAVPTMHDGAATMTFVFHDDAPWLPRLSLLGWRLEVLEHARPVPMRGEIPDGLAAALADPALLAADHSPNGVAWNTFIGPGSQLAMSFDGQGLADDPVDYLFGAGAGWLCTANFVYKDQAGDLYLGAAGHCLLEATETSTHGADADADLEGHRVFVCVAQCPLGGFAGNIGANSADARIVSQWAELGPIAYARQHAAGNPGAEVGHDFGLVRIPEALHYLVSPEMPAWGGPTRTLNARPGDGFFIHGNGALVAETAATKSRAGVYIPTISDLSENTPRSWSAVTLSNGGDSGSAVGVVPAGAAAAQGVAGAGLLTHGYGEPLGLLPTIPISLGTKMAQALSMPLEAGLCIEPLLAGDDPETVAPVEGCDDTGPRWRVELRVDGGPPIAAAVDEAAMTWDVGQMSLAPGQHALTATLLDGGEAAGTATVTIDVIGEPACGPRPGAIIAQDPVDAPFGAAEITCFGAHYDAGTDTFEFHLRVADVREVQSPDTFYYDLFFTPSWSSGDEYWLYVSWDGQSFGTPFFANNALPWFIVDTVLPWQATAALDPNDEDVVIISFDAAQLGDTSSGVAVSGARAVTNDDGVPYDTAPDGGGGSYASQARWPALSHSARSGAAPGLEAEHVVLYIDGAFAGAQVIDTATPASWAIRADVAPGTHTALAQWYTARGDLVAQHEISFEAVEPDQDADGVPDGHDNCVSEANPEQHDVDGDGAGDACDAQDNRDTDGDGVQEWQDACPGHDDQADLDADGTPDGCDGDRDGDGVANESDWAPDDASEWQDTDGDGVGDNADSHPDNPHVHDKGKPSDPGPPDDKGKP